jgi:hypothetical protein
VPNCRCKCIQGRSPFHTTDEDLNCTHISFNHNRVEKVIATQHGPLSTPTRFIGKVRVNHLPAAHAVRGRAQVWYSTLCWINFSTIPVETKFDTDLQNWRLFSGLWPRLCSCITPVGWDTAALTKQEN